MTIAGIGLGPRDARFCTLNPKIMDNFYRRCAIFALIFLVFGLQMEITHIISQNRAQNSTELHDFAN